MTLAVNPSPSLPRITLIDSLRGIALIAMASYHFTWDLSFFGYLEPGTATQGGWKLYARAIASSFLFLAGVSLVLAHSSTIRWRSFWKRFAVVAGAAAAISLATFIATPKEWIFFGILHNIAISSLVGLAFVRLRALASASAAGLIVFVMVMDSHVFAGIVRSALFEPKALAWIGLSPSAPRSNDFVPLFPWLAATLAGVAAGRFALDHGWLERLAQVQTRKNFLSWAGRHSLLIYLTHQPVLIAIIYIFSLVSPAPLPDPRQTYMDSCERGCISEGNEVGLCVQFCNCTADLLAQQSLMERMQRPEIDQQTEEKVQAIAMECSARLR